MALRFWGRNHLFHPFFDLFKEKSGVFHANLAVFFEDMLIDHFFEGFSPENVFS